MQCSRVALSIIAVLHSTLSTELRPVVARFEFADYAWKRA
jgi:hypothetical protein